MPQAGAPAAQGLYDPRFEHDACGVGFVVHVKGERSNRIVRQALQVLINLLHRGACGCEANTGDGAGILMQMPDRFLRKVTPMAGVKLPEPRQYGVGMVFLPPDPAERANAERIFREIVVTEGQTLLGWRDIPTNNSSLGDTAKASEPVMRQVFIARSASLRDPMAFERKLYVIRKRAEQSIRYNASVPGGRWFYIASLSYK